MAEKKFWRGTVFVKKT